MDKKIIHLDDLDVQQFIDAVQNLSNLSVSEKLSGITMYVGVDQNNKIFTTSTEDARKKYYDPKDYPFFASNNPYRAALAALLTQSQIIEQIMSSTELVALTVAYNDYDPYDAGGKSFISIVGSTNETPTDVAENLLKALKGKSTTITIDVVDTANGKDLSVKKTRLDFEFSGPKKIDTTKINVDVQTSIEALQKYITQDSGILNLSNLELITIPITKIDADVREDAKKQRDRIQSKILLDFKLPIKAQFIKAFAKKLKGDSYDGVIAKSDSGEAIKITDQNQSKAISDFGKVMRAKITGKIQSTSENDSIEDRGGILGDLKIRAADYFGNVNLAVPREATRILSAIQGTSTHEALTALAASLKGRHDLQGTIRKISAMISSSLDHLQKQLSEFQTNKSRYKLKLSSGEVIKLSKIDIKRTLLAFAETRRDLIELQSKVKNAKSFEAVLDAFYGRQLRDARESKVVENLLNDAMLLEKRHATDEKLYAGKTAWELVNIYIATICLMTVLYKDDDKVGIKFYGRDHQHLKIKSFSSEMKPLNFWGYAIWRSGTPAVKKLIGEKTAKELTKYTSKVPVLWWKILHQEYSQGGNVEIHFNNHLETIKLLISYVPLMMTDRVLSMLSGAFSYDRLNHDERVKYVVKLYQYSTQFIPSSPLIMRLRVIQRNLLSTPIDPTAEEPNTMLPNLLHQVISIAEDDAPEAPAQTSIATTADAIADKQKQLFAGVTKRDLNVELRARNPKKIKALRMKFKRDKMSGKLSEATLDFKRADATDAGSTDVTNSSSDIAFNTMRNTINSNGEVTGSSVANYLERAAEINDEVPSVAFGLETDQGEIVKVWVNAEEAEAFEAEMKKMLGIENDIEEAINNLALKFDIIDVVWPDEEDEVHDDKIAGFDELDDEEISEHSDYDEITDEMSSNEDSSYDVLSDKTT